MNHSETLKPDVNFKQMAKHKKMML